jgi:hypothetical protein
MALFDIKASKDERTSQGGPAVVVYAPKSDEPSSAAQTLVRKGRHLDVDGVLARSLPNPGAFSVKDIKTIVLR